MVCCLMSSACCLLSFVVVVVCLCLLFSVGVRGRLVCVVLVYRFV